MSYVHEGPSLYLAADRQTVVPEGDPRAAFLLAAQGSPVPDDIAHAHGLIDEKGRPAPPNKLRPGPGENKGAAPGQAEERPDGAAPGIQEDGQGLEPVVAFTPAPAFEEAVSEEATKPKRGKKE